MLTQLYANNASTTLSSAMGTGDTVIQVSSAAAFPRPNTNQYFRVTVDSGTAIEVIYVYGVSGNSFTGCVRGQEGTTAQTFQAGTVIECRVTAGTLAQFLRAQDRLGPVASVDALAAPSNSDGNSYLTTAVDDGGNPIVAISKNGQTWRFIGYSSVVLSGTAAAGGTTTKLAYSGAAVAVQLPVTGKYIIQFTTGANQGLARAVTGSDTTGVTWSTPLPNAPTLGDAFEVYQSNASNMSNLNSTASSGLLFSILFSE